MKAKAKTPNRSSRAVTKAPVKRNPPVTLKSLHAEFQALNKSLMTAEELHDAFKANSDHLAVALSNVRRLIGEKVQLQDVIEDLRQKVAALTAGLNPPAPSLADVEDSHAKGRCYPCGFTLATDKTEGCVPGDCCFRPEPGSVDYIGWRQRMDFERKVRLGQPVQSRCVETQLPVIGDGAQSPTQR